MFTLLLNHFLDYGQNGKLIPASQLESQIRLSTWRLHVPHAWRSNPLVRRPIHTQRQAMPSYPNPTVLPIPTHQLTSPERTLRPVRPPLPNLLPANLSPPPTPRNLLHRYLPPAHHTPYNLYVHNRRSGRRHCLRNRRGASSARRILPTPRLPRLVRTRESAKRGALKGYKCTATDAW